MSWLHIGDASVLRHPRNPYEAEWADGTDVYPLAFGYVKKFAGRLGLKKPLLAGLARTALAEWTMAPGKPPANDNGLVLRWFAFDPGNGEKPDPRHSFFTDRGESGVLFAGAWSKAGVHASKPRLRVIFHVFHRDKTRRVRFTGVSMTPGDAGDGEPLTETPSPKPPSPGGENVPQVYGDAFPLDPASVVGAGTDEAFDAVAPDMPSSAFEPARKRVALGELRKAKSGRVALSGDYVHVFKSSIVDAGQDGSAKEVALDPDVKEPEVLEKDARTKDFAAISAYYHALSLFRRMAALGIDAKRYFRCAELPVAIDYRSDFGGGTGGNVRNADVRWAAPPRYDKRGRVLMRFGLADLNLDAPLGMTCDVRWFWHELGHVILMGATGEREFAFCHSAGDALAAVLCAPKSRLTWHELWHGVTFPWVQLSNERRHDRSASDGWAWGGALDRNEDGYVQEQILSSTMFRLYRALGGESETEQQRVAAAEHTAYLLIRAIGLLGPAAIVRARNVDHLVSALIDADIGTSKLAIDPGVIRIGGTAHKIVRWAFERQGMRVEPVDVYIDGAREGGYLGRLGGELAVSALPVVGKTTQVRLKVANRGTAHAKNVQVTVWALRAPDGDLRRPSAPPVSKPQKVQLAAGASRNLRFNWTPEEPGAHLLLAEATCDDDRSLWEPETGLPCALMGAPLDQLLAGDNNLAKAEVAVKAK